MQITFGVITSLTRMILPWALNSSDGEAARRLRRQSGAVAQHDAARRRRYLDRRCCFQRGQGARHGLDGQPEIIGNILARHRQFDRVVFGSALRHFQKKAGDPFSRVLDQKKCTILYTVQLATGQRKELLGHRRVAGSKLSEGTTLDHQHSGVAYGLSRQTMFIGEFETENIAWQIKSADLASAVAQDFVSTDSAAKDFVKVIRGL